MKTVLLENPVNLHRKSVKIIDEEDNIKIQFTYSATLPSKMHVFFNAEDLSLPHQIRVQPSKLLWGPIQLEPGIHVTFDSKMHDLQLSKRQFIQAIEERQLQHVLDIMIVMVPIRPVVTSPEISEMPVPHEPKKNFPGNKAKIHLGNSPTSVIPAPAEKLAVVGEFSAFKVLIDEHQSMKLKFMSQRYLVLIE